MNRLFVHRSKFRLPITRICRRRDLSSSATVSRSSNQSPAFDQPDKSENSFDQPDKNEQHLLSSYDFNRTFEVKAYRSIHDVQEGGYINLNPTDLKKYLPEGLAGEMEDEMDFTSRQSWMIRNSGKFLCRLVENFEARKANRSSLPKVYSSASAVNLPGLTDRAEWSSSVFRAQYYGNDVVNTVRTKDGIVAQTSHDFTIDDTIEKISTLSRGISETFPSKIMLTGSRGVGKSSALTQMVMHARQRGWLCLFVPKGWDQVMRGWYIQPALTDASAAAAAATEEMSLVSEEDSEYPGLPPASDLYDNPFMSAEVLRGFWRAHHGMLKEIPIANVEALAKYESTLAQFKQQWMRAISLPGRENLGFLQMRAVIEDESNFPEQDELDVDVLEDFDFPSFKPPQNLEELVRLGVAFRDVAGSVVLDLVHELEQLESVNVLIAVDQYNTWESDSAFRYLKRPVHSRELCVPRALSFITRHKAEVAPRQLKNGLFVCAMTQKHSEGAGGRRGLGPAGAYEDSRSSVPLIVQVPTYSHVEFLSALMYYVNQNRVHYDLTAPDLLAYRMFCASNPRQARLQVVSFFFPLQAAKFMHTDFMMAESLFDGELKRRRELGMKAISPKYEIDVSTRAEDSFDYMPKSLTEEEEEELEYAALMEEEESRKEKNKSKSKKSVKTGKRRK